MNRVFNVIVGNLNLGKLLNDPIKVTGGLTHQMYKIETTKGIYVIKLLNPNIMKRKDALNNFTNADKLEEVLKINNIDAIYSLVINNHKLHMVDNQYLYIYPLYEGKVLKDDEIDFPHIKKISKVLADIHNIDIKNKKYIQDKKNIDWEYYIKKAKEENIEVYNLIYDKLNILNESMNKANEVINKLPNVLTICHNDMDSKNVMWKDDEFKIIDLECLEYSNPYLELYELALCWSGYEKCNINFDKFCIFINNYLKYTKLSSNIDWEVLYYASSGRLEWLLYNLKRSLKIECSSTEEYHIGMKEVKETIDHIVYYDKVKDDILYYLSKISEKYMDDE